MSTVQVNLVVYIVSLLYCSAIAVQCCVHPVFLTPSYVSEEVGVNLKGVRKKLLSLKKQ